jgi:DNA-binding CsgD family transcriptional regulator
MPSSALVSAEDQRSSLTPRELEVLALVARGDSNKTIAKTLDIADGTVKTHLTAVFRKLNVGSRTQASQVAAHMPEVTDEQVRKVLGGQLSIGSRLSGGTRCYLPEGKLLFSKGATTDALYYIVRGTVHLEELGIDRGPGALVGEMGLFSSDNRRVCTARCKTDCVLVSVTAKDAMRICLQDPSFSLYVAGLITRRLQGGE